MLLIKSYSECYSQRWDDFVMHSETASFFHLIGWKDAIEKVFKHKPHYLMAIRGEKVCGILPLFEMKSRLFGHALVSVPFGVYGGISSIDGDSYDLLRSSAENLANLIGVDYLEVRQTDAVVTGSNTNVDRAPSTLPVNANGRDNPYWLSKDLYVTFQRPILETVDENFGAIPRKQRRMIRQGMAHGLSSEVVGAESLERFYSIYARNVRDLGSPVYPLSFFKELMENFKDSFILSVRKDGKMVAGVLTFVFKDTLMPYYGGGLREYFKYAINDFMYWELMKYGCERGYGCFDFGRSKRDTGSYHFKRHWGFEPEELNYLYYLIKAKSMPNVSPVNPKYRLSIHVWKRLPLRLTNWLGPKLVRGIP
jgi:FemAB-related protein (PEP-CTERM system-associated)